MSAGGSRSSVQVDLAAVQRRTVRVLVVGQVFGGVGIGATLSIGSVLAADVSGSEAWAGASATLSTLGAAAAAIPLARLAARAGRRMALTLGVLASALGAVMTVVAASGRIFPLLLLGFALLGAGAAVNLQSRFAATDLAPPERRGRDLSVVVWSATVGAVVGPNLFGPGQGIAAALGMPPLTGSFVIALAFQLAATATYLVGLRPDPYLLASARPAVPRQVAAGSSAGRRALFFAIGAVAASHAVMVSVMSMTPVHLTHHGASLTIIGFTISLHVAGMFALSPVFGMLADRVGRIGTVLIGQGILALALLLVALGSEQTSLVTLGLVLLGLGWSASTVAGSALVSDLATGAQRTRIQGRTDLVMNATGAVGGGLAGPVLALVGYPGLAACAAVLVLLTALSAVALGTIARNARRLVVADG
ncbi:MAG: transporter [Naasia sp.]|uniref:MFS transporter n=1 Tax=Naasia sp. TaxID=2546198 RepID=UPI00261220CE|nr:MFS transporter [Naasia sp.]MCU1571698.1 transporter [Naasia sp.]